MRPGAIKYCSKCEELFLTLCCIRSKSQFGDDGIRLDAIAVGLGSLQFLPRIHLHRNTNKSHLLSSVAKSGSHVFSQLKIQIL